MLLHRYVFARLWRPLLATGAITLCLLSLENSVRVMLFAERVPSPALAVTKFAVLLLPEYLGIGLLIAPYIAVGAAVRSLALAGEWQILCAVSGRPSRLLFVPLLLGCTCCCAELVVQFEYQPRGERGLDALISDVRDGRLGIRSNKGDALKLGKGMSFIADRQQRDGSFRNIILTSPDRIVTAERGIIGIGDDGSFGLLLGRGQLLRARADGGYHVATFAGLRLHIRSPEAAHLIRRVASPIDHESYDQLIPQAVAEQTSKSSSRVATAAVGARLSFALMALLSPLLGLSLGAPALRGRSAFALGLGLLGIIADVRATSFAQQHFSSAPVPAFMTLYVISVALVISLWRLEGLGGPGFIEGLLEKRLRRAGALLNRWRPEARAGVKFSTEVVPRRAVPTPCGSASSSITTRSIKSRTASQ